MKAAIFITALIVSGLARAQEQGDVVFELHAMRTPVVYQVGERIELELSFSSLVPGKFGIITTSDRRDSSLLNEAYSVSPAAGAIDPRESQRALSWGVGGDFMSSQRPLTETPVILHADLNEWLRFTQPGHYLLRAVSPRIFPIGEGPQFPDLLAGKYPVSSNQIELTIVAADTAWSASQLAEITAILDSEKNQEQKMQAVRTLASLDTPEAVAEMARRYGQPVIGGQPDGELFKGIAQSSHSEAAIPVLKARLLDALGTGTESIIQLLSRLVLEQEYRGKPLPPPGESDPEKRKIYQKAISERANRLNELVAEYSAELLASLSRRSGPGRADVLFTLWQHQESHLSDDAPASVDIIRLRAEMIASVNDLSREQQYSILEFQWKRIGSRALLPLVRRLATQPAGQETFLNIRDTAFKRWCELDPEECGVAVLEEIENPNTRVQNSTLLLLPPGEKPELDSLLSARLAESKAGAADPQRTALLIERYASKALLAQVREYMTGPTPGPVEICEVSSRLLAYLLRVNHKVGVPLAVSALQRRGPDTGCARSLLTSLADLHYVTQLSDIAEAAVRADPDPEVAGNAALMLAAHGPASAERLIWDRFAEWSRKWAGREEDLRYRPLAGEAFGADRTFEDNAAHALGNATAWEVTPGDYNLLSHLCVTQNCRNNAKNWSERH